MEFDRFPDLRQLRTFDAVVRHGSLVAAAASLHISQPAVTYLIKEMESDFGKQVLERKARGTQLTSEGKLLALRCERFLAQLRSAVSHLIDSLRLACDADLVMMRLTRLQCRALLAVWDTGDVETAAVQLRVRGQAVLRTLRSFELLCNANFLERGSIRGTLVAEAQEFARRLSLAGQEIEAFMHEAGGSVGAVLRSLRLGVLVLAPRLILAKIVELCLMHYPAQSIEIIEGPYEDLVVLLRAGKIDIIFGALRAPAPFADLSETPILRDPYVLACRRGHPLFRQPVTREMLGAAQYVMPTAGLRREVMLELFSGLNIAPAQQIHTNWLPSIISLLRVSDRLAILSLLQLDEDSSGELRKLDIHVPYDGRHVGLTTRQDWLPTAFQAHFMRSASKVCLLDNEA